MRKLTLKQVKKEALKLGKWKIIDTVYKGATTKKLKCECLKCGVCNTMTWNNIKQSRGCRNCNKLAYVPKRSIQEIRKSFEKEGYVLLSKKFTGSKQKLDYICSGPEKHRHSVTWSNWDSGKRRCPYCMKDIQAKKFKKDFDTIKKAFEKEGYTLLTKIYENNQQRLEYICPIGHRGFISWHSWNSKRKCRCPFCKDSHVSKWEKTIRKFLDSLHISYMPNDKSQLINPKTGYNLELDMWFPDLNKAIECNGVYWHSKERMIKNDKIKQQLCKDQNIDLLVITDKEWNSNVEKCQTDILSFLESK